MWAQSMYIQYWNVYISYVFCCYCFLIIIILLVAQIYSPTDGLLLHVGCQSNSNADTVIKNKNQSRCQTT